MNINNIIDQLKSIYPKLYITYDQNNHFMLDQENDMGCVEYKRTLVGCSEKKAEKYATQMRWRMSENIKESSAIYYIGVDDDGSLYKLTENDIMESIKQFVDITNKISTSIVNIHIIGVNNGAVVKIRVKNKKLKDNYMVVFDL